MPGEVASRERVRVLGNLVRSARRDDPAAGLPTAGAQVDDEVGIRDQVRVVLDDDDRGAPVAQPLQHRQQGPHVQRVQTHLVEGREPPLHLREVGGSGKGRPNGAPKQIV